MKERKESIRIISARLATEIEGGSTMIRKYSIHPGQKPTREQLKEVEEAKKHPIVFDEDCEELSPAVQKAFRSAVVSRNRRNGRRQA